MTVLAAAAAGCWRWCWR